MEPGWWSLAEAYLVLGGGLDELGHYSRGCRCHRLSALSGGEEGMNLTTYFLRRCAYTKDSSRKRPCPARGMLAPEFACKACTRIFGAGFSKIQISALAKHTWDQKRWPGQDDA